MAESKQERSERLKMESAEDINKRHRNGTLWDKKEKRKKKCTTG